jgi:type I restriction-modification system DNA methylase subunit
MSNLSKQLTNVLSKETQKKGGIYFTPLEDVKVIVKEVMKHKPTIKTVLEPSCGSCEFIRYIDEIKSTNLQIDGYETNKTIFKEIKQLKFNNKVNLYNKDFICSKTKQYDLIIGNPPYFEITYEQQNTFFNTSKINIYLLFIMKSLEHLNKDGILAFVLPSSFLNNRYSNDFRKHITQKYKLLWVHTFKTSRYLNTSQDTCAIIIQNTNSPYKGDFSLQISDTLIFNTKRNIVQLNKILRNSKSLGELGYIVNVGNVLWNENKDILTNITTKTRLIYNTDIINNEIRMNKNKNKSKKHYIDKEGSLEPVIAVNRGYGTSKYTFQYALFIPKNPYLLENHVLAIKKKGKIVVNVESELNKIIESFKDERTLQFIEMVFTNNAINVHEMEHMMPIYNV